jgi:hypothetical protein
MTNKPRLYFPEQALPDEDHETPAGDNRGHEDNWKTTIIENSKTLNTRGGLIPVDRFIAYPSRERKF